MWLRPPSPSLLNTQNFSSKPTSTSSLPGCHRKNIFGPSLHIDFAATMDMRLAKYQQALTSKSLELKTKKQENFELREENKRLRAALRARESSMYSSTFGHTDQKVVFIPASIPPPKDKPSPFLELPAELRNAIYELCLVKGTVYIRPRIEHNHRYNEIQPIECPEWSLLGVNHQVRKEAAKVLLSSNHFILSYCLGSNGNFWSAASLSDRANWWRPGQLRPERTLVGLVETHLKSVSISMDLRSISHDALEFADDMQAWAKYVAPTSSSEHERTITIHDGTKDFADVWVDMCRFYMPVKYLEVDITNIYCPFGCHRWIEKVVNAITCAISKGQCPDTLVILGTKNRSERNELKRAVYVGLNAIHPDKILEGKLTLKTFACCYKNCCSLPIHRDKAFEHLEDEEITFRELRELWFKETHTLR